MAVKFTGIKEWQHEKAALVRTYCDEVREKLGEYVPEGVVSFRREKRLG